MNKNRRNGILGDLNSSKGNEVIITGESNGLLKALEYEKMQQSGYMDEEFKGIGTSTDLEGTEKECPICTFLNPIIYNVCEVCNHEFN